MTAGAARTIPTQVLAAVSMSGQKLEMIRDADGWLAITLNGNPSLGCRWSMDQLEQCVVVYLTLLRNRPDDPAVAILPLQIKDDVETIVRTGDTTIDAEGSTENDRT